MSMRRAVLSIFNLRSTICNASEAVSRRPDNCSLLTDAASPRRRWRGLFGLTAHSLPPAARCPEASRNRVPVPDSPRNGVTVPDSPTACGSRLTACGMNLRRSRVASLCLAQLANFEEEYAAGERQREIQVPEYADPEPDIGAR